MSTPKKTSLLLISLSFLGLGFFATSFLPTAVSQEKKPIAKSPTDLELFRASATRFENAFNAHNSKAIAAQFLENAEVVDESGQVVQGRALIETRFAESFKNFPQAQIKIEITSVRRLSPEVAVEDGVSTITLDPTEPASRNTYSVVHVKREGQWLFASVKDFLPNPSSHHMTICKISHGSSATGWTKVITVESKRPVNGLTTKIICSSITG